jgi:hypothetical protein
MINFTSNDLQATAERLLELEAASHLAVFLSLSHGGGLKTASSMLGRGAWIVSEMLLRPINTCLPSQVDRNGWQTGLRQAAVIMILKEQAHDQISSYQRAFFAVNVL